MKSRKETEEASRKEHILKVAESLFAQKGLQNTSVADIAHMAEFGIGTLYKYFSDKNTLIASLVEIRILEHFDTLEHALQSDGNPPALIEKFISAYLHSINRRRDFFKVYFTNFHPASNNETLLGLENLEKRKMELFGRVDDIYKKGIESGYFLNVGDAGYLTAATWGMLMAFYFRAEHKRNGEFNVAKMKEILQKLLFEKVRLSI